MLIFWVPAFAGTTNLGLFEVPISHPGAVAVVVNGGEGVEVGTGIGSARHDQVEQFFGLSRIECAQRFYRLQCGGGVAG